MFVAIGRMSAPSDPGTPRTQSTAASKVIALASARFGPRTRGARAASLSEGYERGEVTDIAKVMLARQEAGVAFEATLQVRNKLISAYQETMRMWI